ncbi:hypothetical protein KEM56_004307, partial [Ascosphaera pollenicola]
SYIVCADGGTNRFFAVMKQLNRQDIEAPDVIIGDLDSIKPEIRAHYEAMGVDVQHVADQNSTDFGKALMLINDRRAEILKRSKTESQEAEEGKLDVIVMGGLGGRLDQAMSQLHNIYNISRNKDPTSPSFQTGDIYLFSESSLSFYLSPGRSYIYFRPKRTLTNLSPSFPLDTPPDELEAVIAPKQMKKWPADHPYICEASALMPLGKPAVLTSKGYKWDVTEWESSFEGQISTSNYLRSEVLRVDASWWVLFSVELADRLKLWRE